MRSGRGWRRRSLRGVDVTIWLDIDDFLLTGGTPPGLGCVPPVCIIISCPALASPVCSAAILNCAELRRRQLDSRTGCKLRLIDFVKESTPFDAHERLVHVVRALHRYRLPAAAPLLAPPQSAWTFHRRPRSFALSRVKAADFGAGMHQRRQVRVIGPLSFRRRA